MKASRWFSCMLQSVVTLGDGNALHTRRQPQPVQSSKTAEECVCRPRLGPCVSDRRPRHCTVSLRCGSTGGLDSRDGIASKRAEAVRFASAVQRTRMHLATTARSLRDLALEASPVCVRGTAL